MGFSPLSGPCACSPVGIILLHFALLLNHLLHQHSLQKYTLNSLHTRGIADGHRRGHALIRSGSTRRKTSRPLARGILMKPPVQAIRRSTARLGLFVRRGEIAKLWRATGRSQTGSFPPFLSIPACRSGRLSPSGPAYAKNVRLYLDSWRKVGDSTECMTSWMHGTACSACCFLSQGKTSCKYNLAIQPR